MKTAVVFPGQGSQSVGMMNGFADAPVVRLGLLHGRMGAEEKEQAMVDFANGLRDILVSTSVVEVGIDVPNATVILTRSDSPAGSLSTATSGEVTSTYDASTGVWTASGAIADVNTLLAGVVFNPATNYNNSFTIATSVDDGTAAPITGMKNVTGTH